MLKSHPVRILVSCFFVILSGCGGGSSSDSPKNDNATAAFTLWGNAVKSEISGAEIRAHYYDENGQSQELAAINAPVITDNAGRFSFQVAESDLGLIEDRALIVSTSGGVMGDGGNAPVITATLLDAQRLTNDDGAQLNLSFASSVATGLVERVLQENPTADRSQLESVLRKVEQELAVDLAEDPADANSSLAKLNLLIDQNLNLFEDTSNNALVTELVAYFVANLSSSSGELDNAMRALDGIDIDVDAGFDAPITPGLAAAFVG